MQSVSIFYPAFAMFLLTFISIAMMGISRYIAIKKRQVKISFYKTYDKGTQPDRLQILSRHAHNHFEVPPLFYLALIMAYVTSVVSVPMLVLAWLYVAARFAHTFVHLGNNNVSIRFAVFGFSLLILFLLWLMTLIAMLNL